MLLDRLYYEIKLLGKRSILTPLMLLLGFVLLAFLLNSRQVNPARTLLAGVEMMLPIAMGAIIGTVIAQDAALELQLTVPHKYHHTAVLRFSCLLVLSVSLALIYINSMNGLHLIYLPSFMQNWSPLVRLLLIQLIWLAPLLWCLAVGSCFALLLQSRTAGVALLGGIWIAEIIFKDFIALTDWLRPFLLFPATLLGFPQTDATWEQYNKYFLVTRIELTATAIILFVLGWLLLRNSERMLKGSVEE
ncbi:hypothetical protein [Dictyobacter kobayashii]|uniref:Uncharacterized protein n=1 Tax=Dictyobacter kobayashii TaxID=2014872 RepID=A0A402AUT6_9CHLR|nr:hypothetical protein [Dictyobacter kobayashii]GCE22890.1 hypothetical protein KDK_66900 [Dictyobacter kobayashii]